MSFCSVNNALNALLDSQTQYAQNLLGKRIWLACSGGRDSLALAHACLQLYLAGKLSFCPQLLHVNHGLQQHNDAWADLVSNWAKQHDMICYVVHATLEGTNEQAARDARYAAMMQCMRQDDVLMLAHHMDDQAETVLMRLFNGAGQTGLSGIAPWSNKTQQQHRIYLWRPWLNITRQQITHYAQQQKLPYVDDPTNLAGYNARSWMRQQLLPLITSKYPQALNGIARSANILSDNAEVLHHVYHEDIRRCMYDAFVYHDWNMVLDITRIKTLPIARQKLLLHNWLKTNESTAASKVRVDEVLDLVHQVNPEQKAQLYWQGQQFSYTICRYRDQLHRLRNDWLNCLQEPYTTNYDIDFSIDDPSNAPLILKTTVNDQGDSIIWQLTAGFIESLTKHLSLCDTKISAQLRIRPLNRQDKFSLSNKTQIPILHLGKQSGKKLLQTLGIARWYRQHVVVIEINQIPAFVLTPTQHWSFKDYANIYQNHISEVFIQHS